MGRFLGALLFIAAGLAHADAPVIPNTPAGQALAAWLDAFNSGDRNWERTGVEHDVKVPAEDALEEALRRARSGS